MIPQRQPNRNDNRRKSRDGDWICIRCSNYNYSFRTKCNRCQVQDRQINQYAISLIGVSNYGENTFPNALFIPLSTEESDKQGFTAKQYKNKQNQDSKRYRSELEICSKFKRKQSTKIEKGQLISIQNQMDFNKSTIFDVVANNQNWINKLID